MPEFLDPVELFWDHLLSRQPEQILAAFRSIPPETKQRVLAHLRSMIEDEGYAEEQQQSAQSALEVLENS
jgi:hypothetical protein